MTITPHLFEAFLTCATKCHLRSLGETSSGNEYAGWVRAQDESYRNDGAKHLLETTPETERAIAPGMETLKTARWRLAVDVRVRALESPSPEPCSSRAASIFLASGPPVGPRAFEPQPARLERVQSDGFEWRQPLIRNARLGPAQDKRRGNHGP